MFIDWVLGVLFRPAATFDWARQNLRFGYWWILLSDITLNVVMAIYMPQAAGTPPLSGSDKASFAIMFLLVLYDVQAALLLGIGRAFRWQVSWPLALKCVGLAWSVLLLQDILLFYPSLKVMDQFVFWGMIPFLLWYLVVLTVGVKRLSGFSGRKAFLLVTLATLPWQVGIVWLQWIALRA